MTDYSQIVDFSAKDVLTSGNAAKAVKGTEMDAELAAISTAILSKYDSADIASQSEAEAATDNTKLMTPLRAAQLVAAVGASQTKIKTANETVSNSTTLQDDDHIASITLAAAQSYYVDGVLICAYKAASDIKLLLTNDNAPTSESLSWTIWGSAAAAAVQTDNTTAAALTGIASDQVVLIRVTGVLVAHGSGSTMKLQWAQNSAVSENTVLQTGSFLVVTPVLG